MEVSDVLGIAERYNATIIAGEEGLRRKVTSIEVMEVPEVQDWVREGLLVITTFYSVRNNPKEQAGIINVLIENGAAGIIIKIGRFIKKLPDEVIEMAKTNAFPIIILPKDVPYIHILNPLYAELHQANVKDNPYISQEFEKRSYNTVEQALEDLSELINASVYIEDIEGRLLYQTDKMLRDGWRNSTLLFSLPSYSDYKSVVADWINQLRDKSILVSNIAGQKKRIVIPLIAKDDIFALIHIVFIKKDMTEKFNRHVAMQIMNKIYLTMMGELIEIQQQSMMQREMLNQLILEHLQGPNNVILYVKRKKDHLSYPHTFPVDYQSLYRKNVAMLVNQLSHVQHYHIFEDQYEIFVLLNFVELDANGTDKLKEELEGVLQRSSIADSYIAISSVFSDFNEVDEKVRAVKKIMDIGEEVYPDEKVHTYNRLGIYEFFISLSSDRGVQTYVDEIVHPLYERNDSLLETLIVYLRENGNASLTAKKLYVNRRTITYRINKIEEILGMDLNHAESKFILQFCLKIKELE